MGKLEGSRKFYLRGVKYLIPLIFLFLTLAQACSEKCETCKECAFDVSDYPQSTIDSNQCVDKEYCGDDLEFIRENASDIISCPEE